MLERVAATALSLLIALPVAPAAAADTLEEVLAVVGTTPILASDVDLAELVRLVPREPSETRAAYRSRLLTARVRLELQLADLESSGTLYRLELDLERGREALLARAPGAEELDRGLAAAGLDRTDVDDLALRLVAADAYAEQRLRSRVTVTMDELETAYRELVVEPARAAGEPVPALADVRDALRRVLVERYLNDEIEAWLAEARERFDVTRFAP